MPRSQNRTKSKDEKKEAAWTLFDVRRLGRNGGRRESNTLSDGAKANMSAKKKRKKKPSSTYA